MVNNRIQRVMGFDFGLKRIGVAMGQRLSCTAQPVGTISADNGIPNPEQLAKLIEEWRPDGFVVGLPLNMDGTASELSKRANKFCNRLQNNFRRPAYTLDERLSTFEAKGIAAQRGHKGNYKQDPVDAIAAVLILESWLDQHPFAEDTETTP